MSSTTTANIERVAFISLGCPKNLVDSEQMLGTVREAGFTVVSSDDPADAIVVNTCGFLESSKEESLQVIREAIARRDAVEEELFFRLGGVRAGLVRLGYVLHSRVRLVHCGVLGSAHAKGVLRRAELGCEVY